MEIDATYETRPCHDRDQTWLIMLECDRFSEEFGSSKRFKVVEETS